MKTLIQKIEKQLAGTPKGMGSHFYWTTTFRYALLQAELKEAKAEAERQATLEASMKSDRRPPC